MVYTFGSFCIMLALVYFFRLNDLQYRKHEWSFVVMNTLNGAASAYCALSVFFDGFWPDGRAFIQILPPLIAAAYLIRSQQAFESAKTQPGSFDLLGAPHQPRGF